MTGREALQKVHAANKETAIAKHVSTLRTFLLRIRIPKETGYCTSYSQKSQRAAAKMAESEDEDSSLNLTGFLFGNINEKGELEDTEILDEVIYSIKWFTAVIALRKMGLYCMQTFVNKCHLQESFTELTCLWL